MRYMITRAITSYKGAVVLYHTSPKTLLSYRGIARASKYSDYFTFGSYQNPEQEILQQLPMKRLPSIVIFFTEFDKTKELNLTQESVKVALYSGSILFGEMSKWLDGFIDEQILNSQAAANFEVEQVQAGHQFSSCKDYKLCIYGYMDPD